MAEAEHLPDRKTKSDTDLAIDTFVDDMLEIYPDLDREGFREGISARVQEHVPDEDEGAEEEEKGAGTKEKVKGLAKEAVGAAKGDEETKAEGRAEREEGAIEGNNRAYFRKLIEETKGRAASRS